MLFQGAQRHFVRRLVSGWFYVASQIDFSDDPDAPPPNLDDVEVAEEIAAFDPSSLMASLTMGLADSLGMFRSRY